MRYIFIIAIILGIAAKANAQTSQDSVSQKYNLFHPTPKDQMRSFETDRPDATESPVTVDAGHFQFETDLFRTERLKTHGIETIRNFYNAFNMKLGITNTLDLQLIAEPFYTQKVSGNGYTHKSSGFGSLTLRAKQNLWGDNGGKTALALLPFINIPTASGKPTIVFPGSFVFINGPKQVVQPLRSVFFRHSPVSLFGSTWDNWPPRFYSAPYRNEDKYRLPTKKGLKRSRSLIICCSSFI